MRLPPRAGEGDGQGGARHRRPRGPGRGDLALRPLLSHADVSAGSRDRDRHEGPSERAGGKVALGGRAASRRAQRGPSRPWFVRSSRRDGATARRSTSLSKPRGASAFDRHLVVVGGGLLHRAVARLPHGFRQRRAAAGDLGQAAERRPWAENSAGSGPARPERLLTMTLMLLPSRAESPIAPSGRSGGTPAPRRSRRLEPGLQRVDRPPDGEDALVRFAARGLGAPEPRGEDRQVAARRLIRVCKDRRTLDEIFDP